MRADLVWPAVIVAVLLVGGFVTIIATGHDAAEYVVFVTGPVVSALVGAVLVKRVAAVQNVTDVVAHQTNSLLSTRLTAIDGALSEAKSERETIASTPPAEHG